MKVNGVDTSVLEKRVKQFEYFYRKNATKYLNSGSLHAAQIAMRNTPPPNIKGGKASASIPQKDYTRPVWDLYSFIKAKQYDRVYTKQPKIKRFLPLMRKKMNENLRNKKKAGYFVFKNSRRNPFIWFFGDKSRGERQYKRIKYRGLLKAMWGLALLAQGGLQSTRFTALFTKSPALKRLFNLNRLRRKDNTQDQYYELENKNFTISSSLERFVFKKMKKPTTTFMRKMINNDFNKYFASGSFPK